MQKYMDCVQKEEVATRPFRCSMFGIFVQLRQQLYISDLSFSLSLFFFSFNCHMWLQKLIM